MSFAVFAPLVRLCSAQTPLLNKTLAANAWIGSYRIENPEKFVNTFPTPKRWPRYNEVKQPPQKDPKEERRPATFYHHRDNVKTSPKKMWWTIKFIRGLSVDEAVKQLSFMQNKPAQICKQVLLEAQELAIKEHNFEFKSDMWIEEALCGKGLVIKGLRKHARMRFGEIHYFYSHIMVKLTEGRPPKDYYSPTPTGDDMLEKYFEKMRSRKVEMGY